MAGFKQGGLSLKRRNNGSASDINFVQFYVDSFDRLYSVDEYGTSALVSNQWSTGCIDEDIPELTKYTDSFTVPSLHIAIFSNSNFRGPLFRKHVTSATFSIDRSGQSNYIVADYDSGTPYFRVTTNRTEINQSNIVCLYIVWNVDGNIHSIPFDNKGEGLANKIDNSILLTTPYRRSIDGGLILSVDPSLHVQVSNAVVFAGTTPQTIFGFDSSVDKVTTIYSSGSNQWAYYTSASGYTVDNQHFNNGYALATMSNNKYSCRWVFRTIGDDKEIFIRLGTAEYNNLSDAEAEKEPLLPGIAKQHGMLIGRIIIQKGATTCKYESVFDVVFQTTAGVTDHNSLTNLQGGNITNSEYYHFDALRFKYLSAVSADVQTQINSLQMLTSGTGITQAFADSHYLKLDGTNGPITGNLLVNNTIYSDTVSANILRVPDISGTTITIGNVSNTEFQYLDTVSANIQTQLKNLSACKIDKTATISAGAGLVGGGYISASPTLSLSAINNAGTYTKVTTDNYGRVVSGTTLLNTDIPSSIDAAKISTGIVSNTEFNYLDGTSANIQNQLSALSAANSQINTTLTSASKWTSTFATVSANSANWQTAYSNTHTHNNKSLLDSIDQNLSTTASPTFAGLAVGNISNTEFSYLDGVSANIQNQLSSLSAVDSQINTTLLSAVNWSSSFTTVQTNSANWQTAYTNTHTHSNKSTLDLINQSLNTSATVYFSSMSATNISASTINVGSVSNTEFSYLDGVSANIQEQINTMILPAIRITPQKYIISSPSTVWVINHDLDRYPLFSVRISTTGYEGEFLQPDVKYDDEMTMTLSWTAPYTGTVCLI